MDTSNHLTAYNVKTKQKKRPILNAVIKKTAKGAFLVQGNDEDGSKLTALVNKEKAMAAVESGVAAWAEGHKPE